MKVEPLLTVWGATINDKYEIEQILGNIEPSSQSSQSNLQIEVLSAR